MEIFKIKINYIKLFSLLLLVVLLGCAAQGPPSGGPKDTTGPKLVSVSPSPGTLNFPVDGKIVMEFSESIAPRSAENSLIVRPSLPEPAVVNVRRNKIVVNFNGKLKDNTTYIVSFGRSIRDYRKNPVSGNVQTAFSTGQNFSRARISGTVFNVGSGKIATIMAWEKDKFLPDSLTYREPDYITTADSEGDFVLNHLAKGTYYLLANAAGQSVKNISSRNKIGLANQMPIPINSDSSHVRYIHFNLMDYNFLERFALQSVQTKERYINCKFSQSVSQENWSELDINFNFAESIIKAWRHDQDPALVSILVDSLPQDTASTIQFANLFSQQGEKILPEKGRMEFAYKPTQDSLAPFLQNSTPASGEGRVKPSDSIQLNFSEPIYNVTPDSDFTLIQVPDSIFIDFRIEFVDDNSLRIIPDTLLPQQSRFILQCRSHEWQDYFQNNYRDSIFTINFQTQDPRKFGYMAGELQLGDQLQYSNIVLKATRIENPYTDYTRADSTGNFRFDQLLPGEYQVSIFHDTNNNGEYDPGSLYPVQAAEDYISFPDKIEIRARWETAGIILR
ncbi:MAG: Ig-like domain-containing protein [Candidatus Marinimicrobia bacterium]|nr:Ig-like domain-containing protein [Candidatus Neomarinimicrobiota bacterium]